MNREEEEGIEKQGKERVNEKKALIKREKKRQVLLLRREGRKD